MSTAIRSIAEHPVVAAWRALSGSRGPVAAVEPLRQSERSTVYRLWGAVAGGRAVVGKRRKWADLKAERVIYERVLPHFPLPTPRYYGWIEDESPGHSWIFVEDVGDQR